MFAALRRKKLRREALKTECEGRFELGVDTSNGEHMIRRPQPEGSSLSGSGFVLYK